MNGRHFLVKKAILFDRVALTDLAGCEYDEKLGCWRWAEGGDVVVKSSKLGSPIHGTKKKDIETGEDEKAE